MGIQNAIGVAAIVRHGYVMGVNIAMTVRVSS